MVRKIWVQAVTIVGASNEDRKSATDVPFYLPLGGGAFGFQTTSGDHNISWMHIPE